MTMGYTQAAMKLEYRMYDSKRARSAMAPETMVHAVAANCGDGPDGSAPCCWNTRIAPCVIWPVADHGCWTDARAAVTKM